jgi:acetyl esterase/lipase
MIKKLAAFSFVCLGLAVGLLTGCATGSNIYTSANAAPPSSQTLAAAEAKPSFSYGLLQLGVKLSGYKKIYSGSPASVAAYSLKHDTAAARKPPARFAKKYRITQTSIDGRPCYLFTPKKNARTDLAVFFVYGGGMVLDPFMDHWIMITAILDELKCPVCLPLYPIYPETDATVVVTACIKAYQWLETEESEARIVGIGDSSGGYLLLSFCHYVTEQNIPLSLPDRLVCVSPASVCGIDAETEAAMKETARHDNVLSLNIVRNLRTLYHLDNKTINWFSAPFSGDFSRFPPLYVFSGTDEIFYPEMAGFVRQVEATGGHITLYTGYEMMHVWPFMPVASESKAARELILKIVNGDEK